MLQISHKSFVYLRAVLGRKKLKIGIEIIDVSQIVELIFGGLNLNSKMFFLPLLLNTLVQATHIKQKPIMKLQNSNNAIKVLSIKRTMFQFEMESCAVK